MSLGLPRMSVLIICTNERVMWTVILQIKLFTKKKSRGLQLGESRQLPVHLLLLRGKTPEKRVVKGIRTADSCLRLASLWISMCPVQ